MHPVVTAPNPLGKAQAHGGSSESLWDAGKGQGLEGLNRSTGSLGRWSTAANFSENWLVPFEELVRVASCPGHTWDLAHAECILPKGAPLQLLSMSLG